MLQQFFDGVRRAGLSLPIAALFMIVMSVDAPWAAESDPSKEFNDCAGAAWCPRMVTLPSGEYVMGSPASEADRFDDEGPQRRVKIRSFAEGKYDVTRGQYAVFVAETHRPIAKDCFFAFSKDPSWRDTGFPQADDHPVVCITWREAQAYAAWRRVRA